MKKLFGILTALIPLFYVLITALLLYISPDDDITIAAIVGIVLLALIICAVYSSFRHKAESLFLAWMNLWIIGGNLLIFLAQIVIMTITIIDVRIAEQQGAFEGGLAIVALWFVFLPIRINYFFCRITAALCAYKALQDRVKDGIRSLHTLLHIFPVLDMVSAIWVYGKVKRCQAFQQPTIETE